MRGLSSELRRRLLDLEQAIFTDSAGGRPGASDVEKTLGPLAPAELGERIQLLGRAAAGQTTDYPDRFGVAGVRQFSSSGGSTLYQLSIETFPQHVNNLYLVTSPDHDPFLFDVGSGTSSTRAEFERANAILGRVFGETDLFDRVREVVISHGHIDHFGGVGVWKQRGARVAIHEYDRRVVTQFEQRIIVSALGIRAFLRWAGVPDGERAELEELYVSSKNYFQSVPVDLTLEGGDHFHGYPIHHAPGHCPGQVCLQVHDILLTADHVLSRTTPVQSPESLTPSAGLDHYLESLAATGRIPGVRLALAGHEDPIDDLAARVAEIDAFHRARLRKVQAICAAGPKSLRDIARELFGERTGYDRLLALLEAGAHIEYLDRRGLVDIENVQALLRERDPVLLYRASSSSC